MLLVQRWGGIERPPAFALFHSKNGVISSLFPFWSGLGDVFHERELVELAYQKKVWRTTPLCFLLTLWKEKNENF